MVEHTTLNWPWVKQVNVVLSFNLKQLKLYQRPAWKSCVALSWGENIVVVLPDIAATSVPPLGHLLTSTKIAKNCHLWMSCGALEIFGQFFCVLRLLSSIQRNWFYYFITPWSQQHLVSKSRSSGAVAQTCTAPIVLKNFFGNMLSHCLSTC